MTLDYFDGSYQFCIATVNRIWMQLVLVAGNPFSGSEQASRSGLCRDDRIHPPSPCDERESSISGTILPHCALR